MDRARRYSSALGASSGSSAYAHGHRGADADLLAHFIAPHGSDGAPDAVTEAATTTPLDVFIRQGTGAAALGATAGSTGQRLGGSMLRRRPASSSVLGRSRGSAGAGGSSDGAGQLTRPLSGGRRGPAPAPGPAVLTLTLTQHDHHVNNLLHHHQQHVHVHPEAGVGPSLARVGPSVLPIGVPATASGPGPDTVPPSRAFQDLQLSASQRQLPRVPPSATPTLPQQGFRLSHRGNMAATSPLPAARASAVSALRRNSSTSTSMSGGGTGRAPLTPHRNTSTGSLGASLGLGAGLGLGGGLAGGVGTPLHAVAAQPILHHPPLGIVEGVVRIVPSASTPSLLGQSLLLQRSASAGTTSGRAPVGFPGPGLSHAGIGSGTGAGTGTGAGAGVGASAGAGAGAGAGVGSPPSQVRGSFHFGSTTSGDRMNVYAGPNGKLLFGSAVSGRVPPVEGGAVGAGGGQPSDRRRQGRGTAASPTTAGAIAAALDQALTSHGQYGTQFPVTQHRFRALQTAFEDIIATIQHDDTRDLLIRIKDGYDTVVHGGVPPIGAFELDSSTGRSGDPGSIALSAGTDLGHWYSRRQSVDTAQADGGLADPELPADVVRLQDIVRRQQAVIEELEGRLQDLSDDDDMDMGSTGLPTPRPAIISRVVPPLNVGAIEPCSSDDDDDDVDDEGEGEEVEDGEPGEEEGEGVEREAEGGEEGEEGEDAEPYARGHGDEDPYGGQQDLDPHPGPDGRA